MKERTSISGPQYEDGPIRCQENLPILPYQIWQLDAARRGGPSVKEKSLPIDYCALPIDWQGKDSDGRSLRINAQCEMGNGQCGRKVLYLDVFDISKLGLPPYQSLNKLEQQSKVITQLSCRASGMGSCETKEENVYVRFKTGCHRDGTCSCGFEFARLADGSGFEPGKNKTGGCGRRPDYRRRP